MMIVALVFGLVGSFSIVGGLMGFKKAGSRASLIAGGTSGLFLLAAAGLVSGGLCIGRVSLVNRAEQGKYRDARQKQGCSDVLAELIALKVPQLPTITDAKRGFPVIRHNRAFVRHNRDGYRPDQAVCPAEQGDTGSGHPSGLCQSKCTRWRK